MQTERSSDLPAPTSTTAVTHGESGPTEARAASAQTDTLPTVYRGKSSGEFQRVVSHPVPDIESLVAEAEAFLTSLSRHDRNRRLLEVAVLRRDPALLGGILESLRRAR